MSISDYGIVPSMSEGFCRTAVQMQSMDLPLIASHVGALPEVLHPDTTIFVPYGKVVEMRKVLQDALSPENNSKNTYKSEQEIVKNEFSDLEEYFTLFMKSPSSQSK